MHIDPFPQDDAGTQKTDAGDDLRCDPIDSIGATCAFNTTILLSGGETGKLTYYRAEDPANDKRD